MGSQSRELSMRKLNMEANEFTMGWETWKARWKHLERRGSSEWLVQVE